jgi:NADP-dependent 3-hydroxy acid dehydrogenase YdfG
MGIVSSTVLAIKQCFPPKTDYTVDKIPDMSGCIVIVTGANTGIGFETAKVSRHYPCQSQNIARTFGIHSSKQHVYYYPQALLSHNAKVYMAMRNLEKGEAAIEKLQNDTGKTAIFLELDLGDLKSVLAASEEFLRCVYSVIRVRLY